ncbi:MAG: AIR synthase-related protein [Candidatus Woesearchaeota archaeon]
MQTINTIEVVDRTLDRSDTISDLEFALRDVGIKDAKAFSTFMYTLRGDNNTIILQKAGELVHHSVTQEHLIDTSLESSEWDFAIKVDYKPGVTDNAARVLHSDLNLIGITDTEVYTSMIHYIKGNFNIEQKDQLERLASNPLIQDITILKRQEFEKQGGFEKKINPVDLGERVNFFWVNVGAMDRDELIRTGELGTLNTNIEQNPKQIRGGELALEIDYMEVIHDYANSGLNTINGREKGFLTDTELEVLAQMWSEHCRHSLFNARFPGSSKGIFHEYIKKPTIEVLKDKPYLGVSIYKDNSGVFRFNDKWNVLIKNETHNSPSALDPFGGAITGIVGVNRDPAGTGIGGEVIGNFLFYFFGNLDDERKYYKSRQGLVKNVRLPEKAINDLGLEEQVTFWQRGTGEISQAFISESDIKKYNLQDKVELWRGDPSTLLLNPKQIDRGVNKGVEEGGNKMGIPIYLGTRVQHDNYNGKPIVGVGSWGRQPVEINGSLAHEKKIDVGDRLYIIGGRAGRDGIHGATFSSKSLTTTSPPTAVQIGDPYTQKKMFDAMLELRDKGYIKFVTDLGAGGVSCASLEMAEETGGLDADLDKLLVKYPGMTATELLLNESQERMAIAVDEKNKGDIEAILKKHEVEFSDIGMFTNSGRAVFIANNEEVVNLDMNFIHHGYPQRELQPADYKLSRQEISEMEKLYEKTWRNMFGNKTISKSIKDEFYSMLKRPNLSSVASFMDKMDSSVKGLGVQHCIQGKGKISTKSACSLVDINSDEGLVQAYGFSERQSYIDSRKMGRNSFLRAIGKNIAMGGNLDYMVATDQFLWQSSNEPKYQKMLIEAAEGMAEVIETLKLPVTSGKDSMFNQAVTYDEFGNQIKRGVFPTLQMITFSKLDDVDNIVTIDAKDEGDLVYVVGSTTKADMGGSEYTNMISQKAGKDLYVGIVSDENLDDVYDTFKKINQAQKNNLLKSANYVEAGGLVTAIKETAMAGEKGIDFDLERVHSESIMSLTEKMYSETEGRFIVTINQEHRKEFERIFEGKYSRIGEVKGDRLNIHSGRMLILSESIDDLMPNYHIQTQQKAA